MWFVQLDPLPRTRHVLLYSPQLPPTRSSRLDSAESGRGHRLRGREPLDQVVVEHRERRVGDDLDDVRRVQLRVAAELADLIGIEAAGARDEVRETGDRGFAGVERRRGLR